MFKVRVVAVGKIREPYLRDAIGEYAKRLGRYCTLEVVEVADEDISAGESAAQVERHLRAEADRLAARIWGGAREGRYVAALDLRGDAPDSVGFAEKLRAIMGERPEISFVIGGSCGLHTELLSRANCRLSLSNLTFPHQLARLILLEQVYRAFKIINNETYHK